ncbi:hypothetical protein [Sphaerospermopsis sp. LEGE 08334]|jgi:hypothetical protein|uniref:hypothetical protein n=1 Tax=Sphaerospermopsis sp. LEGE 08334 TaxID=1828651 RepID=UPI001880435B|nr:hypothetical protein [Sphaerospermopsis sp. LEGE 08334]MBE9054648.1 hypothetical protein [Sphaerospermopsis sp. LEGE 08334]
MFSLDKPEELIKIRLISGIWNNQFNSPEKIESLFQLASPDIIVLDQNQQIALLVDITVQEILKNNENNLSKVSNLYLQNSQENPRFTMLANLTEIKVFKSIKGVFVKPEISLNTGKILSNYDSEFGEKTIFKFYLQTLIVSWLRDLTYHWKSEIPPASEELGKIGLLAKLKNGETYSQNYE